MGLVLGIVPGIGGLAGTAMLLPFTFNMDPYSAFALLLGLGVDHRHRRPHPGDPVRRPGRCRLGRNRARRHPDGEAGRGRARAQRRLHVVDDGRHLRRAAARHAVPILRPVMLYIGSPELLAFAVLGISMVAVLSGNAPLRGLTAGFGIMIAITADRHAALDLRQPLSLGRLPLTPVLLGLFALPELCDLADRAHRDRGQDRWRSTRASGRA